ncbi:MATE family efflux transporter [Actibacterium ureilyticum]|uniref:MATE family efflux transporter n=1 Tax=Actibacterium ureilyticum TaxID=1590614 RepID=UPI000BAADFDA|nr:MATE family efflux transporter [Actibacterium ureilyticum]
MTTRSAYRRHVTETLRLGLPLAGSLLAQFSVGVVDVIMMGWYGVDALAAVVLGSSAFFVLFIFGSGFAHAVTPLVAEAAAKGYEPEMRRVTRMALWICAGFAVLILPLTWFSAPVLRALGQEAALSDQAQIYLRIVGFQLLPALTAMVLRSFLSALERTRFIFWITILGAAANAALNWVLIFGKLGAPELGIQGCALASLLANLLIMAAFLAHTGWARAIRKYALFHRLWKPDPDALRGVFRLGLPISLTLLAEVGLFSAAAFMFGWIGVNDLAAHGIAIQIASATFLVHLGLSQAATIRAGRARGKGDQAWLRGGALTATLISLVLALIAAGVFLAVPEVLIGLFLDPDNPQRADIVRIGAVLLMIGGVFQLADAAQVMALGLLRGVQDTTVPMLIAGVSYWGIGLPASYVLAFPMGLGGPGVWWGIVLGLLASAVLLSGRFWRRASRIEGADGP